MYKKPHTLVLTIIVFVSLLFILHLMGNPPQESAKGYSKEFLYYTGTLCYILFSLIIFIAARPKVIEYFGPLDNLYKIHKYLGIYACIIVAIHFIFNSYLKKLVKYIFNFDPNPTTALAGPFLPSIKSLSEDIAQVVCYVGLVLFIITFLSYVTYKYWKISHKIFAILYLLSVPHVIAESPVVYHLSILGIVQIICTILGVYACIITLFNLHGFSKRHKGTISYIQQNDYSCNIKVKTNEPINCHNGQFFFLSNNGKNAHPFSLCTQHDNEYEFLIKKQGEFTHSLSNLKQGDPFVIEGPYGNFKLTLPQENEHYLYFAQGIGIAPFVYIIKDLDKLEFKGKLSLVILTSNAQHDFVLNKYKQELMQAKSNINLIINDSSVNSRLDLNTLDKDISKIYFCGSKQLGKALKQIFDKVEKSGQFYQEYCKWR